jgi:hypothetical protein
MSKTSFNDWQIATKLYVIQSIALVTLFVITIAWLGTWMTGVLYEDSTAMVKQANHQILNMIGIYENLLEENITRMDNIMSEMLPHNYALDTTRRVAIGEAQTPVLRAGGETMNLNFSMVDRFSEMSGGVATIFARDGDDFVRITTSLKNEKGERAIGTKLAHDHPARTALLANKPYTGRATLFGRDYMTHYLPVRDDSGAIIATLFAGLDFTDELKRCGRKSARSSSAAAATRMCSTPGRKRAR